MEMVRQDQASTLEKVLIEGDLGKLTAEQRLEYYQMVCKSLGVNPLTKPFSYITLNNRLVLYTNRDAAEQLRKLNGVSITGLEHELMDDLYIVTAQAKDDAGRTDTSTGVVNLAGLKGDNLANALMKAETKAKRRVTLSICGLGWLDETEVESIPDAKPVDFTAPPPSTPPVVEARDTPRAAKEVVVALKQAAHAKAKDIVDQGWEVKAPTEKQRKALYSLYRQTFSDFEGERQTDVIHAFHANVWGTPSGKELTGPQVSVLIDWLKSPEQDNWNPSMTAAKEALAVANMPGEGQQEF